MTTTTLRTARRRPHEARPRQVLPPPSRPLDRDACAAWVEQHGEGRLGYGTGCGPRSVVVAYAPRADEVLVALPEYHPATGYLLGAEATLVVEGRGPDGAWTRVRATGVARLGDGTEVGAEAPARAGWPDGVAVHVVHLPLTRLDGTLQPG